MFIYQQLNSVMTERTHGLPAFILVDDDDDDRLLMRMALDEANLGFPVEEFVNGADFLAYLEQDTNQRQDGRPHWLVIMDVNMPIVSGPDALKTMQAHEVWRQVPVMMMSTSDDPHLARTLVAVGAKNYVVKPKSYTGLIHQIKTTFGPWMQQHAAQNGVAS
jgi:CheY-like chemotaxis protein